MPRYYLCCYSMQGDLRGLLENFDPDVHHPSQPYPTGKATFTSDPDKAMSFASQAEAWEFWKQTSKTHPVRPDGRPNRPLTGYHASIVSDQEIAANGLADKPEDHLAGGETVLDLTRRKPA
jgi:hypothetical protein